MATISLTDSIFTKLNNEELLLINELYLEMKKYKNIIDELEKWCDIQFQVYKDLDKIQDSRISCQYLRMKDKLKELKDESN